MHLHFFICQCWTVNQGNILIGIVKINYRFIYKHKIKYPLNFFIGQNQNLKISSARANNTTQKFDICINFLLLALTAFTDINFVNAKMINPCVGIPCVGQTKICISSTNHNLQISCDMWGNIFMSSNKKSLEKWNVIKAEDGLVYLKSYYGYFLNSSLNGVIGSNKIAGEDEKWSIVESPHPNKGLFIISHNHQRNIA